MPSASQLYSSGRWLNAADLQPLNQKRTAIVHSCEPEVIGMAADQKTVLMLSLVSRQGQAWPKKLPLNKGNSMQMIANFGDNYEDWPGKSIEVWAENVMFQGRMVPGIKIQAAPNGTAAQPSAQAPIPTAPAPAPAPASPSPSATAVTGITQAAAPTWNTVPRGTPIEDDAIPF